MLKRENPGSESDQTRVLDETSFPYPPYVKSDPVLKSIFSRIRAGQPFKFSEFTHFIAPLVQGFEAAVAHFMDGQAAVLGGLEAGSGRDELRVSDFPLENLRFLHPFSSNRLFCRKLTGA